MNPFEIKEKQIRWEIDVNDKLQELSEVPLMYQTIVDSLAEIKSLLLEKQKAPEDTILDNKDFIKLMGISARTAQQWRDDGLIQFSQIGNKIFYRMSDVLMLLDSNLKSAVKTKYLTLSK